jgi:putative molybdopterin biosynthesis protein
VLSALAPRERVRILNVGSTAGLQALKVGVADVAGVHLLDRETGEYNVPYIKRMGLRGVMLIRGYLREVGFVFRKGLSVSSMGDVVDKGLRFVNRNPGSGTRTLIDLLLEEESRKRGIDVEDLKRMVRGYNFEVKTHEAVAYLVSRSAVDVGVAVRYAAERYGLDFTPISRERYDVVVRRDSTDKELVKRLVDRFSELVREFVKDFEGYEIDEETGNVLNFPVDPSTS